MSDVAGFPGLVFSLRKLRDVLAGVLKRNKLAPAWQRDRFVKLTLPAPIANDASPSYRYRQGSRLMPRGPKGEKRPADVVGNAFGGASLRSPRIR